jgi:hypothetical protein
MIFVLGNSVWIPGKMAEVNEIAQKELSLLYPKVGTKVAGSFHTYTGNMNENYTLFAYEDLTAMQKAREAQRKNVDFQKIAVKLNALRISQVQTILEPISLVANEIVEG